MASFYTLPLFNREREKERKKERERLFRGENFPVLMAEAIIKYFTNIGGKSFFSWGKILKKNSPKLKDFRRPFTAFFLRSTGTLSVVIIFIEIIQLYLHILFFVAYQLIVGSFLPLI